MKISNIILAIGLLFFTSCGGRTAAEEHGHEHGPDADHAHGADGQHEAGDNTEQEEFKLRETNETSPVSVSNVETEASVATKQQENEVSITIPSKKGVEYKFYLKQYEKLTYEWTSEAPLYFDFHGEPLDYATTKYFESFVESTSNKMKGTMTIPFEGSHGWYWKNDSDKDVSVTLMTKGNYKILGLR
jgi:hypothetical protein